MDCIKEFKYMGTTAKIFPNRVEYKFATKNETYLIKNIVAIETIAMLACVDLKMSDGKKYRIPIALNERDDFKNAIYELM